MVIDAHKRDVGQVIPPNAVGVLASRARTGGEEISQPLQARKPQDLTVPWSPDRWLHNYGGFGVWYRSIVLPVICEERGTDLDGITVYGCNIV
jgi:hypothetical protein